MGIRIEDLTVTFKNKVTAIDHADLEIPKGIFGLLGEKAPPLWETPFLSPKIYLQIT